MTIVGPAIIETSCVPLPRYAELMEINENAFFGLNDGTGSEPCDHIWTHAERKRIARYLHEAQEEIEQVTGYPLCPTWFENEAQPYGYPVHAKWMKVLQCGFKNSSIVAAASVVSYTTDPAVIGPVATTVTDVDEIRVYYPGTTIEIAPSSVIIAGGNVTITIPWARLVAPIHFENPADGWDYDDIPPSASTPYTTTVDVKREYLDDSIQAGLIWPHHSSAGCDCDCAECGGTCGEYSVNACMYIRDAETGAIDVLEAAHDVTTGWTANCSTCYCEYPSIIRLNYQAGLAEITTQMEEAVIRLAHAKMSYAPCGCSTIQDTWARDHKEIENPSPEQTMCPFGTLSGAWFAWRQVQMAKNQRALALG